MTASNTGTSRNASTASVHGGQLGVPATIPNLGYGVLLADPAWKFKLYSEKGEEKSAQAHYGCMTFEEMGALREHLQLDFIMAPDCVCVMWATWPMLPDAHALMLGWGFEYKTGGAWHKKSTTGAKDAFGTGYIYRSASEPWLLGTRGRPASRSKSIRNIIEAPIRGHSRKPDIMHDMIEAQFGGPYLELFSRCERPGWQAWGNETEKFTPDQPDNWRRLGDVAEGIVEDVGRGKPKGSRE